MLKILTIILIMSLPSTNDNIITDHVDLIEVNEYTIGEKKPLKQLIFKNWSRQHKRYIIIDFRMVLSEDMLPVESKGEYVSRWHELEYMMEVTSKYRCYTFTNKDPELIDRNITPEEDRMKIKAPPQNVPSFISSNARAFLVVILRAWLNK